MGCFQVHLPFGIRRINNGNNQRRFPQLGKCRLKAGKQTIGKAADESNGVAKQYVSSMTCQAANRGIQRYKGHVLSQ